MNIARLIVTTLFLSVFSSGQTSELLFENSDFEKGSLYNWKATGIAMINQTKKGDQTTIRDQASGKVLIPIPEVSLVDEYSTFPHYAQVGYDQSLRPQFHFTSRMNWLNDPNGMVYYDGEWFMFFQHVANKNDTGIKSWGAAVSRDLMHWEQLPHAINPYPNVMWNEGSVHSIWSGSAIVDVHNALGMQKGDVKTLFALYTATHRGSDQKAAFFQAGAYSTDRGRTWTKIDGGRPIIEHQVGFSGGQRDPRIIYYEPGDYYITIMMVGGKDRSVRLWKSKNLLNWEPILDIPNKAAECIDIYSLAVDGDQNQKKWVIADATTRYEVGDFDGKTWEGFGVVDSKGKTLKFDYGDAYYAAQAFNQAPDGRVVHIGWLRSKQNGYRPFLEAGMPFTQQMSIPAEITLKTTSEGIRMFRNPVEEIKAAYINSVEFKNMKGMQLNKKLKGLSLELIDMSLDFKPSENFTLNVRGLNINYDVGKQAFNFTNEKRVKGEREAMMRLSENKRKKYRDNGFREIPASTQNGMVNIRVLVDRASLEIFVNHGQAAASFVVVPDSENLKISIDGHEGLDVLKCEINEIGSIWKLSKF